MDITTGGVTDSNAAIGDDRSSRPIWLGEDHRGWDHIRVHRDVILDPRITHYHLAAYAGLAMHAELRTGDARPAEATLAEYAQCSERKVRDCLRELSDWRYIEIELRPGKASFYRLLPPPNLSPPRHGGPTNKNQEQDLIILLLKTLRARARRPLWISSARGRWSASA